MNVAQGIDHHFGRQTEKYEILSSEAEVLRYNTGHENRYQVCRALNR